MGYNVNIDSQVANYLANCIAGLHIKSHGIELWGAESGAPTDLRLAHAGTRVLTIKNAITKEP